MSLEPELSAELLCSLRDQSEIDRLKHDLADLKNRIKVAQWACSIDDRIKDRLDFPDYLAHHYKNGARALGQLMLEAGHIKIKERRNGDITNHYLYLTVLDEKDRMETLADQIEAARAEGKREGIQAASDWLIRQYQYWGDERDSRYWGERVRDLK